MPRALRLRLLFGRGSGLFFLISLLVGLGVLIGVLLDSDPLHPPTYDRETVGVVANVEDTGNSEDGHDYVVTATFFDDEGKAHAVTSHMDDAPAEQDRVDVRFQHAHPDTALIAGGHAHANRWESPIFVMAFTMLWLALAFRSTKNKRLALRLLPHGVVADGKVVEQTEDSDGEGTTWRTRFEFTTLDNRTSSCEVVLQRRPPYAMGQTWPILYDPGWPDSATPLAHLAGAPTIGADDRIAYKGSTLSVVLIATALAVCAFYAVLLPFAFARWW